IYVMSLNLIFFLPLQNDQLKEALEKERKSIGKYLTQIQQRPHRSTESSSTSADSDKPPQCAMTLPGSHRDNATTLSSQFQKAMHHLATCKRRKCSVCAYTRAVFGNISKGHNNQKYEKKLFSCLQTPFLEMKNLIRPPPSPIHGEGESLSEWFCELGAAEQSECSPWSIPSSLAELAAISYMDDTSETMSHSLPSEESDGNKHVMPPIGSNRGFGSDSGFSSDACGECKSNATTPKEKFSPKATLDEADCVKLTRTKWTASFRKLISRIKK
ncbi:hypothetical protein AMK59_2615, partial [Oryctes borbonicus]